MKTNFAILALFLVGASAVALPEQPTVADLEVTSEFFPGKTFTGTAESIYHEMKALNPSSVGNVTSEEPAESSPALAKRSTFNCGWGAEVKWNSCQEGRNYLLGLGNAWCTVRGGYGQIARVSCSNRCGIYLSNKLGNDLSVYCGDIGNDVWDIGTTCRYSDFLVNTHGARDFDSHFIGLGGDNC